MLSGHSLGVLNASSDDVPGTVRLLSSAAHESRGSERKCTANGIILEPQPDDDPNDPLNWPDWRRACALFSLGWHCLLGGGQTPVLAAGFNDVAETFGVSIPRVALTTGLYMLGLGVGCILSSPTALIFGKRPVYLAGAVLFLASSVWAASSASYSSLLVARIVMGIGVAPCESMPSATIAELFFLHERAYRIGIYTLLLLGGKNLVPLVSAAIIQAMGWRWVFWIVAIIVGFNLGLLFLFVPETFWDRPARPQSRADQRGPLAGGPSESKLEAELKVASPSELAPTSSPSAASTVADGWSPGDRHADPAGQLPVPGEAMREEALKQLEKPGSARAASFRSSLVLYKGRQQKVGWFQAAFRPFVLFAYPAVLWSTVVYSLSVGWLIVLSESVAEVYQHQPYNFSRLGTGLIYLSPFIGGIIGTAIAGKLSDVVVRAMSRRNNGIYEPEFRLVMGIPVAVSTAIGLMGFGWSAEEQNSWIVPTVFFGIISFGCSLGSTTAITFCVDSYRQYAGEALVTLNFSKNVFHGFVFSLFFNHWLEADGSRKVFVALGAIQMGCLLFTIPLYMYGKRLRLWTLRKNMMGRFE